ncbi:hypothetical protein L0U85_16740 [Glycomyces sp. L485]|uniref:hypothetical protein n=1 Tax=Glycomyces sp. L485 TaxID=2909235 RepID=UPI001F4B8314|nr:hypothetical protein [Glycomyces sp. L485]MCH7232488.1 hypothetical protein [Glycomyces sp. L485]
MTDREEEPEQGGEMRPEDVDRRFNELIRDLNPDHSSGLPEPMTPPAPPPAEEDEPTLLELWDAELPEDEDEEDYEPPEPPPMPWPSLPAIGGVLFILGGLLLLVRPGIAPLGTNPGRLIGFLVFVVGVWLLISRLKDDSAEGETDDGAVV